MKILLTIFLFFCTIYNGFSQFWQISTHKKYATIPFEYVNNLILISVKLNGEPLSFLLDNGVKETLLFGKIDSLQLKNVSSIAFNGLGVGTPILGKVSRNNQLKIGELVDSAHHLYVIDDSTFNLSKNVGEHVHGVLGSSFFRGNVVAIDYVRKKITFAQNLEDLNIKLSKYTFLPIEVQNDRAYVVADIVNKKQTFEEQKMLVDLGNADPMMLFDGLIPNYEITKPRIREYLGLGFNGEVFGYI